MLRNIIVLIKIVPKPEEVVFNPETKTVDRSKARNEINEADKNALELALKLKEKYGGKVITLSMGPPIWDKYIRLGVAMGADDAILVSDRALVGSDTLPTSLTLATAIKRIGDYDIILCGEESSDGGTGQVPPGIGGWLDIPHITYVSDIADISEDGWATVKRTIKGGHELIKVRIPFIAAVELGSNKPRFPDFRRKRWAEREFQLKIWSLQDLGLEPDRVGFQGSKTTVTKLEEVKPSERKREVLTGEPEELAKKLYHILKEYL